MRTWKRGSDTLIIVIHEIYGINAHINGVCRDMADAGYDVICPDLLDGKPAFPYEREEEAYQYFFNYAGFESSVKRVAFLIRQAELEYRRIFLLGFSAGATIAWLCGGNLPSLNGVIGLYGSRIRDRLDLTPKCPTLLIFSKEEKSFDPVILKEKLMQKDQLEVHILEGRHGFADPYSEQYNETSAAEAKKLVAEFLIRQESLPGPGNEKR